MKIIFVFLSLILFNSCAHNPQQRLAALTGIDHHRNKVQVNFKDKKATIAVFLSSTCPCSNSHIDLLRQMSNKHQDFQFIGIHSNYNEKLSSSQSYFKKAKLGFPVIYDKESHLAKKLGAVKTPHVFILNNKAETIYSGAITNSSNAKRAEKNYLSMALSEISQGKKPTQPKRKTLGCYIALKD